MQMFQRKEFCLVDVFKKIRGRDYNMSRSCLLDITWIKKVKMFLLLFAIFMNASFAEDKAKELKNEMIIRENVMRASVFFCYNQDFIKIANIAKKNPYIKNHMIYLVSTYEPCIHPLEDKIVVALGNDKLVHVLDLNPIHPRGINDMLKGESISLASEKEAYDYFLFIFSISRGNLEKLVNSLEEFDSSDFRFVKFASREHSIWGLWGFLKNPDSIEDFLRKEIKPLKITKQSRYYIFDYYTYIKDSIRVKRKRTVIRKSGEIIFNETEIILDLYLRGIRF